MIDWQQLAAYLLLGTGGTGAVVAGLYAAWQKLRTRKPVADAPGSVIEYRSADEPSPVGAVEWAADICKAMGSAPDSSKLAAILSGSTRDQARARRIAELENTEATK